MINNSLVTVFYIFDIPNTLVPENSTRLIYATGKIVYINMLANVFEIIEYAVIGVSTLKCVMLELR